MRGTIIARWQDWSGAGIQHLVLREGPAGVDAEAAVLATVDSLRLAARFRIRCDLSGAVPPAALTRASAALPAGADLRHHGANAGARRMRRWSRHALLAVAVIGWTGAAWLAYAVVARLGWFGVLLVGIAILGPALCAELHDDAPAASPHLLRRQYEQAFEGSAESRLERWAARLQRDRNLYIARTIGIALTLLGLNEFIVHQL